MNLRLPPLRDPNDPSVRHLKTLPTARGTKLIASGWWGVARHINYTGDWLMGLAWCLPCGVQHITPYFYAVYFATLLIHRQAVDACLFEWSPSQTVGPSLLTCAGTCATTMPALSSTARTGTSSRSWCRTGSSRISIERSSERS